jgi:hypothetical protein
MVNKFSDLFIVVAIIILFLLLFKGFNYLLYITIYEFGYHDDNNYIEVFYKSLDKYLIYVSDILDTILLLIGCYLLFIRKNNSIFTSFFGFMLIIKFILHFLLLDRFEVYFDYKHNLSKETVEKLLNIKRVNSFITNIGMFLMSAYMLNVIFGE